MYKNLGILRKCVKNYTLEFYSPLKCVHFLYIGKITNSLCFPLVTCDAKCQFVCSLLKVYYFFN
jgi:hypothetical protein